MSYFVTFLAAFILAAIITPVIIQIARRFGIVDVPNVPRKIHTKPIPFLGGMAPFLAFILVAGFLLLFTPYLFADELPIKKLIGVGVGGLILMIGGFFDDKKNLRPSLQIIAPVLAVLVVIASGVGIHEITNPFGNGAISLVTWERVLFWWQGTPYQLSLPADLFTFVWLMGMMYTTKFLDGLDGLVSGLTVIGATMIFFLTMTAQWYQPEVGMLAVIVAGAFAGFLIWNFHPARVFLGEGGSLFAGYMLGVLAVISGGKIATTLLVFGIPILDAAWVIVRRVFWEKKSPVHGDRKHLHFRLLDNGFSHRGAVVALYVVAMLFGVLTLVLQSSEKIVALSVLAVLLVIAGSLLVHLGKSKSV